MKDMKQKVLSLFSKSLDEAMPEEKPMQDQEPADVGAALNAIMERLGKIEAAMNPAAVEEKPAVDEEPVAEEKPAVDEEPVAEEKPAVDVEPASVEQRLASIEAALAKLLGIEQSEPEGGMMDADACTDAETIARAEILSPGIAKTGDVKKKALDAAMATEEGKAVIGTLLAGKAFDSADKDMLFVSASELMKGMRRKQFSSQVSLDSVPGMKAGEMTPEKINAMNAERYGKN